MGLSSLQVYRTLGPAPIVICPVVSSTILATLTHGILRKVFGYGVALFLETVAQKAQKCVGTWAAPMWLAGKSSAVSAGAPQTCQHRCVWGLTKWRLRSSGDQCLHF